MEEKEFNDRLRELIKEIAGLPTDQQKKIGPLVEETKRRHKAIKETVNNIASSLLDLRICIKYLLFDLEATKRERNHLRDMLKLPPDDPKKADGNI